MKKSTLLYAVISFGVVFSCRAQRSETDNTRNMNNRFKAPDSQFDITTYGARAVASGFSTTASCNGTTAIKLKEASLFRNGDGITIYGCGPTNSLSTPGAPKVIPSIAAGGTNTGIVTNSAMGSSMYSYEIVARDRYGALTAAGSATTIAAGQSSLGLQNATITSMTRSNDVVTFNTSAPSLIAAGSLIHITGASNPDFDGWYIVSTMNTTSQGIINHTPIDSRGIGWNFGDSDSASGGNIAYYLSNHVTWTAVAGAWEYYIYGKRPGDSTYNVIGQTLPSAGGWIDVQFDDFGPSFMANQTFPTYVPHTAPSVATNDPLTTTIVSGAGTTSLIVANAASQTTSGQTALFDDAPAILAAATASISAGPVYISPVPNGSSFIVNSYLSLPQHVKIQQAATLSLNETLNLVDVVWNGNSIQGGTPQFAYIGPANVQINAANPGIYESGGTGVTEYVTFGTSGTNGGTIWVSQDEYSGVWNYVNFESNFANNNDYLGRALVIRSMSSGGNLYHFDMSSFNGGPNQVTNKSWTPLVYFPPNQNGSGRLFNNQNYIVYCDGCYFNRRGVEEEMSGGTSGKWEFHDSYRQGGITPFMAVGNSNGTAAGSFMFDNMLQDTEAIGTLALWGSPGGSFDVTVNASFLNNNSADVDGAPPPFSGYRINGARIFGSHLGTVPNRTSDVATVQACSVTYPYNMTKTNTCTNEPMKKMFETMDFPAKHSLFWDLSTPSGVTAGAAINGGSLASGTAYYYTVSATGVDGGETVPATFASSSTTTSSNRTIPVSWTGIAGAASYNVYRCTSTCVYSDGRIATSGNWRLVDRLVSTTRINDSGLGVSQGPPTATGTGSVGANAKEVYAPAFVTVSPLSNGRSYAATDVAPITANRTYTKPDQSGTYALDLTGSTSVITGTLLSATCDSGIARVAGAMVGMPVVVGTKDGSDLGGAYNIRASVTSDNTVTVYVCGTGKPPSKAYNVRVIQ